MSRPLTDPIKRFQEKIMPEPNSGCWIWMGRLNEGGYGLFSEKNAGKGWGHLFAHRYSWQIANGAIPENLTVDHLCRTPSCVNPEHLRLVTLRENVLSGDNPAAQNARKTSCPRGHLFTAENTITNMNTSGGLSRTCRICSREAVRRYREKRRALA